MHKEDKVRILKGSVHYQKQWMPTAKKVTLEKKRRKKIEQGFVFYQGEWITIDEKLARTSPAQAPAQQPQNITINQTYNQQTYDQRTIDQRTIDKRTIHEHEHKHVHLDAETLAAYAQNRQNLDGPSGISIEGEARPAIGNKKRKKRRALSDKSGKHYLEDRSTDSRKPKQIPLKKSDAVDLSDLSEVKEDVEVFEVKDVNDIANINNKKGDSIIKDRNDGSNISEADVDEFLG